MRPVARLWDPIGARYLEAINLVRDYISRNGTSKFPRSHVSETGIKLGDWVTNRRAEYRNKTLTNEQIKKIEEIPGWVWNPFGEYNKKGMGYLKQFVDVHGHSRVPDSFKAKDGFQLGKWVGGRRQDYKRGKLSEKRAKELETLPKWAWDMAEEQFNDGLHKLQNYIALTATLESHARSKMRMGLGLGGWVHKRRQNFKDGKLSKWGFGNSVVFALAV